MHAISVTSAEPEHIDAIVALAEEMDYFYGATEVEPRDLRIRQVTEALFSDHPSGYALLAWREEQLIGFAAYSFLWPAIGLTRSLYLKELYICEAARRSGAGKLLMHRLYSLAVEHDCTRVEWTTDRNNLDAQRFYADLGAHVSGFKLFYRVEIEDLRRAQ